MFAAIALRPVWLSCLAAGAGAIAWSAVSPARSSELPAVSTTAADLQTEPVASPLWQTDRWAGSLPTDDAIAGVPAPPPVSRRESGALGLQHARAIAAPEFAPLPEFQPPSAPDHPAWLSQTTETIDIDPAILEDSPVLQRWLEEIPDVLEDIRHDPSFRSRLRLGYAYFPSTEDKSGWLIGIEDFFIGKTGLTVSAEYQGAFAGERETWGGDLRYYVLPLGSYFNLAPAVGYRNLTSDRYHTDGLAIGAKLILALSRTGAADISLSQMFVSPGSADEVGITTLSTGYAVTEDLRLSVDLQKQNSVGEKDSRVGLTFEWML